MKPAILILLTCIALSVHAQDRNQDKTQAALKQFNAADAELSRVYKECLAYPNAGVQTVNALQETQRRWVDFRDINAVAYTGKGSGNTIYDSYYWYAMTVVTKDRIKELKQLFLSPNHNKPSMANE